MTPSIDYFFYGASPFTYLGHQHLLEVAARHGATIAYKPVDLFALWDQSGAVLPAKRPPVRQRYRLLELQRIADMRGLPLTLKPAFWPLDVTLCDCCTIALVKSGLDPAAYVGSVLAGVWAEEANLADENEIAARLTAAGHDAETILGLAKSEKIAAVRAANTVEAIEQDAVGVPAYVLNGEVFWGQDRIEFVDHALSAERAPFSANID